MAGVIRSINLTKDVSVRILSPPKGSDRTYKSLKRKRGGEELQGAASAASRIAPGSNSSSRRPDKSRLSRSPDSRRTPTDLVRSSSLRGLTRRRSYKSRRLTRTKATLGDNPAGLTFTTVFFFFLIFRVDIYYESEGVARDSI